MLLFTSQHVNQSEQVALTSPLHQRAREKLHALAIRAKAQTSPLYNSYECSRPRLEKNTVLLMVIGQAGLSRCSPRPW